MTGRAVRVNVRMMIATWPQDAPRGAVGVFCREHGISRSQFYEIRALARERNAMEAAAPLVPARRRPDLATSEVIEQSAIRIRKELAEQGWDHGPLSVRQSMVEAGMPAPSRATLARIFTRYGAVTAQPQKRPRSSWRRFTFKYVHQCWQLDATQWQLAGGEKVVIFQLLDDHSRLIVGSWVDTGETSAGAVAVMAAAVANHQAPQLLLTDNGRSMNPHRLGVVSALVTYAESLGVKAITSRAYHPQTMGKNERVHSTLKRWLRARPAPAGIDELAVWVQAFDEYYNQHRPHQGLDMRTPAAVTATDAWALSPQPPEPTPAKPRPSRATPVRTVRVMANGSVRVRGSFIGLGTEHCGKDVLAIVEGQHIAVFDVDGTHLRSVQTTPGQSYYGTGRKGGGTCRRRASTIRQAAELSGPSETELSGPK